MGTVAARWSALKPTKAPFKPLTRKILAATLLVIVVVAEYRLSTLPMAANISGRLSAPAGSELMLTDVTAEGPLLTYSGHVGEAADIRFDRARLSAETVALLRAVGVDVPDAVGPISWITGVENSSKTVFEVVAANRASAIADLRLRALNAPGAKNAQLEIEAHGSPLQAVIGVPYAAEDRSAQSVKTLTIGGQNLRLSGAVPLKIEVPPGAGFRTRFSRADGAPTADFVLGSVAVRTSDSSGLPTRTVAVRKTTDAGSAYDYVACAAHEGATLWRGVSALENTRCVENDARIYGTALNVTPEALQVTLAGAAWAMRDGELVGLDFLSRVAQNRVIAGVLLAVNLALLAWLLAELFGRRLGLKAASWSGGVFMSYRRQDSAPHAGRLYDHLSAHFGEDRVFMDVGTIQVGEDFVRKIRESLNMTDALLAVIGPRWADARDVTGQRRLDDPADFVRIEIATALERGAWVVPVLVGGAAMPRADELPDALAPLAHRNAVVLSDAHFLHDTNRLISALEQGPAQPDVDHAELGAEAAAS